MNAFNSALNVGRGLDDFLTGGTVQGVVSGVKDRNAFRQAQQQIGAGDYGAAQTTLDARSDPRQVLAARAAQAEAEKSRQKGQTEILGRIAQYGDSLPPEARLGYAQSIAPILQQQFDLDDDDVQAIYQAASVPQGFGALAAAFIDPNQQIQNSFEDRTITETGRANVAGEGLRGQEIDVSRGNLQLGRDRLALDRETAPNATNLERTKLDREVFKDTQALRKEFSQVTSDFQDIQRSINNINALGGRKDAASDLALVVSFTKLLDPGSVAREGEVTLSRSAASTIDQASNWLARLQKGNTLLPDNTRDAFLAAANELAQQYDGSFQKRQSEFRGIAEAGQIDPNLVLIGTADPRAANPNERAESQFGEGQVVVNPETGERLELRGGQWVPVQ